MPIDFPKDRTEAGIPGGGPLQEGDNWVYNSIEYTWALSADRLTGMWSAKGINVNPNNYIAKTEPFSGDVEGYYNRPGGFNVTNADTAALATNATNAVLATTATTAQKTQGTLRLQYYDADNNLTQDVSWDGSTSPTFIFRDTDDATVVGPSYTFTNGVTQSGGTVTVDGSVARITGSYVTNSSGTGLYSAYANSAGATSGILTIQYGGSTLGTFNGSSNQTFNIPASSGGGTSSPPQDLLSVLNTGNVATGSNALLNLSSGGNAAVFDGVAGRMELARSTGPYIDFTRNRSLDYECRINQSGVNLILESKGGDVYVNDSSGSPWKLTKPVPSSGGGGGDTIIVSELLPRDLGADVLWTDEDALGSMTNSDNARFGTFVAGVNSGRYSSLFVPGGVNIRLTQQYTFNNKVAFVGPSAALGSNLPGIICAHNGAIGIHAPNGIRARNFKFDGGSKSDPNSSPTVLVFAGGNNGSGNQDDTDSSFRRCEFGTKAGGYALQLNGRNANIGDCAFSNLTNGATCVKLEWRGIQPDPTDGNDAKLETSWRKNRIYDNQFHTNNGTTAIEIDGQHEIRGLIISDNIVDIGAIFLRVRGAGVQGLTFTGNTWYGRRNGEQGVIKFENGAIRSATISGNTFSGFEDGTSTPNNFIRVSSAANVRSLAITGNGFSYCDNRAISLDDSSDATRTTVVGNAFLAVNGGGAAFTDGCVNAANIISAN